MKIYKASDIPQGSEAWMNLRLGRPTSSEFHRIVTPKKCELSKGAVDYALRLCAEKLLNMPASESFTGPWLERGKELEPEAVKQYEWEQEVKTFPVGFITTDDGSMGCSPDRLVLSDLRHALEIKCPSQHVHFGYMLAAAGQSKFGTWDLDGVDDAYRPQVQGQILIAELDKADLFSFHPRMPAALINTVRDEPYIAKLDAALRQFNDNLAEMFERAKTLGAYQAVPRSSAEPEAKEAAELVRQFTAESADKMAKEGFTG